MTTIDANNPKVIIGDSHLGVLKRTQCKIPSAQEWDLYPLGPGNLLAKPFFKLERNEVAFTDSRIKKNLCSISAGKAGKICICGPLNPNRVIRSQLWDEYRPISLQENTSYRSISSNILTEIVNQDAHNLIELSICLSSLGWEVFVIEPPKPFLHHPTTIKHGKNLVRYIDFFYRKHVAEILCHNNINIVDTPRSTYNSEGFTFDKYRAPKERDHHHANSEFGILMWKQIISTLP